MSEGFPPLIASLLAGEDLTQDQAQWAMNEVMSGNASPVALAGFLIALRAKGESIAEVTGLAEGMLAHARPIHVPGPCVDIVGTGGDRSFTVNISTMASLVIAGAGLRVVKHGNRASSSRSGSADVLEALGVNLALPVEAVERIAEEVGIAFLFAQAFHPSMRHAGPVRRELGVATVFNVLGPLTNPARPRAAAIGCADARIAPVLAGVLASRGTSALVFRGEDGLDELAATAPSAIWDVHDGGVSRSVVDGAADLGLRPITIEELRGGDAATNADVARRVLAGEPGPVRETVLFNAAAGLVADGTLPGLARADGCLVNRMRAALGVAGQAIDSGSAQDVLRRWIAASQRESQA